MTSVGATNKQDSITEYTNRGPTQSELDLLAPGGEYGQNPQYSEIVSTFSRRVRDDNDLCFHYWQKYWFWPWWPFVGCNDNDLEIEPYFIRAGGTSMAAPHVAGAVALMLEKNSSLTPEEIETILIDTGKPIWDPGTGVTYPRIDVVEAINNVMYFNSTSSDPTCNASAWVSGSCGGGSCSSSEMSYTRTATPSGCVEETKCEYDAPTCTGGGTTITVCSSGCDYTTIGVAVDNSNSVDRILVSDSRTYSETVYFDSVTASRWIECSAGATIDGDTYGISIDDLVTGAKVIGCNIDSSNDGIYLESSQALIQDNNITGCETGIYMQANIVDAKIKNNRISGCTDYGIEFGSSSWSNAPDNNNMSGNIIENSGSQGVRMRWGMENDLVGNDISGSSGSGDSGIYFYTNGLTSGTDIYENVIHGNYYGVYFDSASYFDFDDNILCSSNSNLDISFSGGTSVSGDDNRCEKPGTWNDSGTTGCSTYCDAPATVDLLYPYNNSVDIDGDVDLVCQSDDDSQLVNVSLYHNITGTWQANETKNISGTSNVTVFSVSDVANGTEFSWSCFSYDNKSRGNFADTNWSVSVDLDYVVPNITAATLNVSSIDLNDYVRVNCTATDLGVGVDGVLIEADKPTSANENYSMSIYSGNTYFVDIQLVEAGTWNFNCWVNDTLGNLANRTVGSVEVNLSVPNDTNKFYHRNSSGSPVAWFGNAGNIALKGSCYSGGSCNSPADGSLIFRDSSLNYVGFVNVSGDLCIETGDCSDQSANCDSPVGGSFVVRNSSLDFVSYVDSTGDLCLIGGLYENVL